MAGGKVAKRKTLKRKKAKRVSKVKSKRGSVKKKSAKKIVKRKTVKKKTVKKKTAKKKTVKKKSVKKSARKSARKSAKKSARKSVKKKPAKRKVRTAKRSAIKIVISAAKKSNKGKRNATRVEKMVFSELENLAGYIHDAKLEIASLRPDEVKDDFLPKAETELGAIVEATEEATHAIMDACDGLEEVSSSLDGQAATLLMNSITKIYEACTFQDITGQRINKVVNTLQHIEGRVDRLIEVFDIKIDKPAIEKAQKQESGEKKGVSDGDLLEGPQLKGHGSSQAEIDNLLASFD